jgi:hypothetical protein
MRLHARVHLIGGRRERCIERSIWREEQRADLQGLTLRLARAGRLRPGVSEAHATATPHMLTSLESFLWLRREYGLSLRQTRNTIAGLARGLLRSWSGAGRGHDRAYAECRGGEADLLGDRLPRRSAATQAKVSPPQPRARRRARGSLLTTRSYESSIISRMASSGTEPSMITVFQ